MHASMAGSAPEAGSGNSYTLTITNISIQTIISIMVIEPRGPE